jgi:hypothetical protein
MNFTMSDKQVLWRDRAVACVGARARPAVAAGPADGWPPRPSDVGQALCQHPTAKIRYAMYRAPQAH